MKIPTELYNQQQLYIPQQGQHILAHFDEESIIVYQAYKPAIADYAVNRQQFGGPEFSYNRMSWIKPNFLWMMFRCGWAVKENQERVLAIRIRKSDFEMILSEAVHSVFRKPVYQSEENWKMLLTQKTVRLQWDPDHNPYGKPIVRRAIQLGMKDDLLKKFGTQFIISIEDITDFVHEQKKLVDKQELDQLLVPVERIFKPGNTALHNMLELD